MSKYKNYFILKMYVLFLRFCLVTWEDLKYNLISFYANNCKTILKQSSYRILFGNDSVKHHYYESLALLPFTFPDVTSFPNSYCLIATSRWIFAMKMLTRAVEEIILNQWCLIGRKRILHSLSMAISLLFPSVGWLPISFSCWWCWLLFPQNALKRNEDVFLLGLVHQVTSVFGKEEYFSCKKQLFPKLALMRL